MKKILIIFDRNISTLPPLLTIIESLIADYELTIIIKDHEEVIEKLYENRSIKFIAFSKPLRKNTRIFRAYNRVNRYHFFHLTIPLLIKQNNYNLIWIASAEAAELLRKPIIGVKYIFSIYELYDIVPDLLRKIKPLAQNAHKIIVPEINRAYMLRFWLGLRETPIIIPNKPASLPKPSFEIPEQLIAYADKKIILYQGHISKDRNLDSVCEAVSNLNGYIMILMGGVHGNYLMKLKSKYPDIIYIDFIPPPFHLNITSRAHIGVVTYEFTDLNAIYCAPNKIWEFSGYGVPMLGKDIPGLLNTIEKHRVGRCVDMNNPHAIKESILHIDNHYDEYKTACKIMYASIDVNQSIRSLVKDCI